jgi:two-component system, sensor histidine kinase
MEFATANEEIQAANEELNATNEELIQTQESLQVVNQELEERVNKRTTDLTSSNDELYRANKEIILSLEKLARTNFELAQTNSELDNFIYTASHDLKAPISNIEGLIIALKKALSSEVLKDPKVSNVLDFMVTSVERFKNTIQELTHISRLQKDGNELEELVPLTEIVEQVSLDFEVLIKSTHATLHVDVSSCPAIRFSRKNLRSIIFNLISNALKYRHHERSPVIRINTISDNTYCILTVCDNGIGLDATKAAKVFSMFGRLHSHVEGSGVGLYIVKKIIENAGGKIELESEVGKGTTFKVYFPTSKDHSNNDL